MTVLLSANSRDDDLALAVLDAAGARGASHEDFVEAGLAPRYVAALRRLVDQRGLAVRVDFTTGTPRWALESDPAVLGRAA